MIMKNKTLVKSYIYIYILVILIKPTFVVSKYPKPSLCWFRNKLNWIKLISKQIKPGKVGFETN